MTQFCFSSLVHRWADWLFTEHCVHLIWRDCWEAPALMRLVHIWNGRIQALFPLFRYYCGPLRKYGQYRPRQRKGKYKKLNEVGVVLSFSSEILNCYALMARRIAWNPSRTTKNRNWNMTRKRLETRLGNIRGFEVLEVLWKVTEETPSFHITHQWMWCMVSLVQFGSSEIGAYLDKRRDKIYFFLDGNKGLSSSNNKLSCLLFCTPIRPKVGSHRTNLARIIVYVRHPIKWKRLQAAVCQHFVKMSLLFYSRL